MSTTRLGAGAGLPAARRRRRRATPGDAVGALVHLVFVVFFLLPLVWLLLAVTKSGSALVRDAPLSPGTLTDLLANWRSLVGFQDGAVLDWVANSALYSLAALALTLLVSVPAGYALALTEFRGRRTLLVTTLVVMLMPSTALVLPVFLEMNALGLIGQAAAVVLPFSFFPFGVYLAFIYFSSSISRTLLEAARIDGCGELRLFLHIALPLSAPVVALVGFFSFVQNWNNYFLPFVMLPSSDDYPIQIGLSSLLSSTPAFNPSAAGSGGVDLPTLALATVVSVLPVLLVFAFAQRFLVTGLTAGGVKG